jgi:serine protease AprX
MTKKKWLFNSLLAFVLAFSLLAGATGTALAENDKPPKADPRLLQMAEENPEAVFRVIVQKETKNKDLKDMELENEVLKGGGKLRKQLGLIVSFSAEMTGKELIKLAKHPKVRWISVDAPMVATGSPGMESVRDEFNSTSFDGNDGTASWSGSWLEAGEGDGAESGILRVVSDYKCASNKCLRLGGKFDDSKTVSVVSLSREVNLNSAASAFLTYRYRRNSGRSRVAVTLSVSSDGGVNWTELAEYKLSGSDSEQISQTFELTQFISDKTMIRFLVSGTFPEESSTYLYVDDIEIAYAYPSAFMSAVKADQLNNLSGSSVTVAVIDSGMAYHNDFKVEGSTNQYRIIANEYFTGSGGSDDWYGHGTHVAGLIGGTGSMSGGQYQGMAPGVNLINLKVSDNIGMTYESDVVEALQWVYNKKDEYNIRVVNLSLNSTVTQSYHTSPLDAAVEILWFNSIVVVVSAGNNGTGTGPVTVYPPANDPFVITVGATEDKGTAGLSDDTLAIFSAYGVTLDGFAKPDLVAPGRNLIAPLATKATTMYTDHPMHRVGDYYFRMSGTSMSAPVVSGAVALLLQDEPNLTPDQVKYRLVTTANYNWSGYALLEPQPVEVLTLDGQLVEMQPATTDEYVYGYENISGYLDIYAAVYGDTTESANQGITVSQMLSTGDDPVTWGSVGWNSVGWNTVGWNTVGWNTVGWNTVGWNTVGWNTSIWDD